MFQRNHRNGFALISVIWALGIIGILALAVTTAAHFRSLTSRNIASQTQADLYAAAAVNIGLVDFSHARVGTLSNDQPHIVLANRRLCALPMGAIARILIEDEGGKIDINTAQDELLYVLFLSAGVPTKLARDLAKEIINFRSVSTNQTSIEKDARRYAEAGLKFGPKYSPFQTIFEIDQVIGMTTNIFASIQPFITTSSRQPGIDPTVASDKMLWALVGGSLGEGSAYGDYENRRLSEVQIRSLAPEYMSVTSKRFFLVRGDIIMQNGAVATREALVDFRADRIPQLEVLEWRKGSKRERAEDELKKIHGGRETSLPNLPSC